MTALHILHLLYPLWGDIIIVFHLAWKSKYGIENQVYGALYFAAVVLLKSDALIDIGKNSAKMVLNGFRT